MLTLSDVRWAAEECERQQSGELSVYNLCNALGYARLIPQATQVGMIELLGKLVEPEKNKGGFRRVPVHFFDLSTALPHYNIHSALTSLIENGGSATAREWYTEFEKIHPFVDGNGRVGSILFNVKNGTLDNPITPPNVFEKQSYGGG